MTERSDRGPDEVRPSRTARRTEVERRLRIQTMVAAAVLVVGVTIAWVQLRGDGAGEVVPTPSVTVAPSTPSTLLTFAVTGGPNALLAVIGEGGGRDPAALVPPPGMTVIAPGRGEQTTEDVGALPPESIRIAVSNIVGAWTDHYAVIDLATFGHVVDRIGGLQVDLPDAVTVGPKVLGPGLTRMTGADVIAYLSGPVEDAGARWLLVLDALLASPPPLAGTVLVGTDDAVAASAVLRNAAGADVQFVPTQVVGGTATIATQPDLDELTAELFAIPTPIPVVVQNGSGVPGIGEPVAAAVLPEGFRVVLSGNAASFDHQRTLIIAAGTEHAQDAERVRDALGAGVVRVTQVPSGLADVRIVVGKDFEG